MECGVLGRSGCPVGLSTRFQGAACFKQRWISVRQRSFVVEATSAESNKCQPRKFGPPLQLLSPAGQYLNDTLVTQPKFFHVCANKLLQELDSDRKSANDRREHSAGTSEACLHRRIASLKELECQRAVEEVMYMLIIEKFISIRVPMYQRMPKGGTNATIDMFPTKNNQLEEIHLPNVKVLVQDYVYSVLSREGHTDETTHWHKAKKKRLHLGRLYAASVLYGYFLKSVCVRHQLENYIARTEQLYPFGTAICVPFLDRQLGDHEEQLPVASRPFDPVSVLSPSLKSFIKPKELRTYLMELNPSTIQLCAKLQSQEATNMIENHSLAVFGDGSITTLESIETLTISHRGMTRMLLEAVAFGTFLFDAERLVDPIYQLTESNFQLNN